jgi:hypothetical protein
MAVLIIGDTERAKIAEMIAYAKAHPLTLDDVRRSAVPDTNVVKLEERRAGWAPLPESQQIEFPGGFRAVFSIEQQAAGFCTHLSVSVYGRSTKGAMPSPEAVGLIANEFGVEFPADRMWMEEYERGEFAINLLSLYLPAVEGHA